MLYARPLDRLIQFDRSKLYLFGTDARKTVNITKADCPETIGKVIFLFYFPFFFLLYVLGLSIAKCVQLAVFVCVSDFSISCVPLCVISHRRPSVFITKRMLHKQNAFIFSVNPPIGIGIGIGTPKSHIPWK